MIGRVRKRPRQVLTEIELSVNMASWTHSQRGRKLELDRGDHEIVMLGNGLIVGRVVDAETGAPIPRFTVRILWTLNPEPDDMSIGLLQEYIDGVEFNSPEGRFRLFPVTAGAPCSIHFDAPGYAATAFDRVVPGTDLTFEPMEIALDRSFIEVAGRVIGTDGAPLAGLFVTAVVHGQRDRELVKYTLSDFRSRLRFVRFMVYRTEISSADGSFRFEGLPAGHPIDLFIQGAGFAATLFARIEEIPDLNRRSIDVAVPREARIVGRVDRAAYRGASRLVLYHALGSLESPIEDTPVWGDGSFEFGELTPGQYLVVVREGGPTDPSSEQEAPPALASQSVIVIEGERAAVEFGPPPQ
jgi:hypothetical protein